MRLPTSCLALVCLVLLLNAWAVAKEPDAPADAAQAEKTKKATLAVISLKEDYPEGPAPAGIFGELKPHLREIIERLDKAAKDDKIAGVMLKFAGRNWAWARSTSCAGPSPGCARRAKKSMPTSRKPRPRTI